MRLIEKYKGVCVFCSSSNRAPEACFETARRLGAAIAHENIPLVFGGVRTGLMGALASAAADAGGVICSILPEDMAVRGLAFEAGSQNRQIVTSGLAERKRLMAAEADAFVALPGGVGTLEELAEFIAEKQLGYHNGPVVILNADGYNTPVVELFDGFIAQGFSRPSFRELYHVADSVEDAMDYLTRYTPPEVESKWS